MILGSSKNKNFLQRNSDRKKRNSYFQNNLINTTKKIKKQLSADLLNFQKNPKTQILRNLISSSSHISNLSWEYVKSFYDFSFLENPNQKTRHQNIIKAVSNNRQLDPIHFEQSDIFHTIFNELKLYSIDKSRKKKITAKPINATIVLISGVFNEMFNQADFERGVQNFCEKNNSDYLVPTISGVKSSIHNTRLLKQQLEDYIKKNPKKKLWIISYSKGGIDLLHYLKKNADFAAKYIIGSSMLAVPILGTYHLEKNRVKLVNLIQQIPHSALQNAINKYGLILSPEFQMALDAKYRQPWFKRNYENMPENIFYTALAFDSNWREGHAWMKLTKIILNTREANDGIVETSNALFPDYFFGVNLGVERGHHLVGVASSSYPQEELIEAHIIYLQYIGVL